MRGHKGTNLVEPLVEQAANMLGASPAYLFARRPRLGGISSIARLLAEQGLGPQPPPGTYGVMSSPGQLPLPFRG